MRHTCVLLTALMLAASAMADDGKPPSTGLSIRVGAGATWASAATANFYSGRPENSNTINRVLHSELYGTEIWQHLVQRGRLSPSAIGSYSELQVVEYPDMYYRTSLCYGIGLRYDYASGFGWLLNVDVARLQAIGAFNLATHTSGGILGTDQYIRCGMLGLENRINIDFGLARTHNLGNNLYLELDLGASLINTKVSENLMEIEGRTWSILDVWNGRSPSHGDIPYDYINQGGIGYGFFIRLLLGYHLQNWGMAKVCYTCAPTHIPLLEYTAWGWQHTLGIQIDMYNISIL